MIFEYIYPDNTKEIISLDFNKSKNDEWEYINSANKLEFVKRFLSAYGVGQKIVLFDAKHKQLLDFYNDSDINKLENIQQANSASQMLFFTSGSSGFPLGAFKSKENLLREVDTLSRLLQGYNIKRVVVSVPFVHIYGILVGMLLPMHLDNVKLVVKEDFLPYELLEEASTEHTLVVTTPLFIKALSKLGVSTSLSSAVFVSSTGPLSVEDAERFEDKFSTNLLQLFGSTETGGIAYKFGRTAKWSTLEHVEISTNDDKLSVTSPFVSAFLLNKKIVKLHQPYATEDIIELDKDGFTLVGRSNKLIKIAGKRISATQIENILETIPEIDKAIVEIVYKKELLRSEQIVITLEAGKKIDKKTIKDKISDYYGVLTIPFSINYVDKINYSAMGKKVLFQ